MNHTVEFQFRYQGTLAKRSIGGNGTLAYEVTIPEIPDPERVLTIGGGIDVEEHVYFYQGQFLLASQPPNPMDQVGQILGHRTADAFCRQRLDALVGPMVVAPSGFYKAISEPVLQIHSGSPNLILSNYTSMPRGAVGLAQLHELPTVHLEAARLRLERMTIHRPEVFLYDFEADPSEPAGVLRTHLLRERYSLDYLEQQLSQDLPALRAELTAYIQTWRRPRHEPSPPTREAKAQNKLAPLTYELPIRFVRATPDVVLPREQLLQRAMARVDPEPTVAEAPSEESFSL